MTASIEGLVGPDVAPLTVADIGAGLSGSAALSSASIGVSGSIGSPVAAVPAVTSTDYQIVPLTEDASQNVRVTLGGQPCRIVVYTKSINVPTAQDIATSPPVYENVNPVFMDLFVNDALILAGVLVLNETRMVRDGYLGFAGDLAIIDLLGSNDGVLQTLPLGAGVHDPVGVPLRLPPVELRNWWQRLLPLKLAGVMPQSVANRIPGLGTRFVLTYWPNLGPTSLPPPTFVPEILELTDDVPEFVLTADDGITILVP